jgi:hypothetical protein
MKWVAPSDGAVVAIARLCAPQIDAFVGMGTIAGHVKALRYHQGASPNATRPQQHTTGANAA